MKYIYFALGLIFIGTAALADNETLVGNVVQVRRTYDVNVLKVLPTCKTSSFLTYCEIKSFPLNGTESEVRNKRSSVSNGKVEFNASAGGYWVAVTTSDPIKVQPMLEEAYRDLNLANEPLEISVNLVK